MTKQELLDEYPYAYSEEIIGRWVIFGGEGRHKVWLGSGETESEAWDKACEEDEYFKAELL